MRNRNRIFFLVCVLVFSAIIFATYKKPMPNRVVASEAEESTSEFLNSHLVSWSETEHGLVFKVSESSGVENLCDKWQSLDIVFRAEGIAYSGEVDRVVQTAACDEGSFEQTWIPNLTQVQGDHIQKTGYFTEEPPKWVMEQIILEGSAGTQVLSMEDIYRQYGSIPMLTPQ